MRARATRRRIVGLTAAIGAMLLTLSACAGGQAISLEVPEQSEAPFAPETQAALEEAVGHAMAMSTSPGALVGVWAPWSGSWVAGVGTTEAGGETAVTPEMAFRAGTVTRPMICDVLYGLAADGRVSLDDPVTDYAVGVPTLTDVTLGQLCDGTSGIGSYAGVLTASWERNPARQWNPRELVSFGLGEAQRSTPGEAYKDAEAGYVLLGLALENATRTSAAELLDEYVFGPLGLGGTELPGPAPAAPGDDALPGFQAARGPDGGFDCAATQDMTVRSASMGFTNSGVVTTVTDLGRYMRALAADSLLAHKAGGNDESDAAKLAAARYAKPLPVAEGVPAWFTATGGVLQAGSLIGQYGAMPGYLTAAFADPATGLVVVAVLNNSTASPALVRDLAWQLAAIASKAAPAAEQTAPEFGLPWTAEQYGDEITQLAVCQPAPEEAPAE